MCEYAAGPLHAPVNGFRGDPQCLCNFLVGQPAEVVQVNHFSLRFGESFQSLTDAATHPIFILLRQIGDMLRLKRHTIRL